MNHPTRLVLVACAAAFALSNALAHDSWMVPGRGPAPDGTAVVELTTGTRYPIQQFNPGTDSVVRAGCSDGAGLVPIEASRDQPAWLEMRVRAAAPLLACFVEMRSYDLEMAPEIVPLYLDEIHASPALREAWRSLQARGLPWLEAYRKFVRLELPAAAAATPAQRAAARAPLGLPLEAVIEGDAPVEARKTASFQVLRDGVPLAGQPVQFLSEKSPVGIWRETDAQGRVSLLLPFGGRWLLRGVELKPAPGKPDQWSSRFLTLGFEAP